MLTLIQDIRLLVVANDQLVRAGLAALLAAEKHVNVVGQESGFSDLAASVETYRPDAVVWDLGWEPSAAISRLEETAASTPIVALLPDDAHAAEALAAGVRGALLRDQPIAAILSALGAVVNGLIVTDPAFGTAGRPSPSSGPEAVGVLTARELEVVRLMAKGLPNKAIADALGVSEHTAKFHVASIMSKLGAQSRTEAVILATRAGLVPL